MINLYNIKDVVKVGEVEEGRQAMDNEYYAHITAGF